MDSNNTNHSRRRFVKATVAGTFGLPLIIASHRSIAADLPRLEESDGTAKALAYVHDATTVSGETRGGADRFCSNCRFYTGGDSDWGPCGLFPGKAVSARGWCRGWVAKS